MNDGISRLGRSNGNGEPDAVMIRGGLPCEWAAIEAIARDRDMLEAYLDVMPGLREFFVFPMGFDGRLVLSAACRRDDLHALGGIDCDVGVAGRYGFEPALTPGDLVDRVYDRILVCHIDPDTEEKLAGFLVAVGVPMDKLIRLYRDPDYLAFVLARWTAARMMELSAVADRITHVVVCGGGRTFPEDDTIGGIFPIQNTLILDLRETGGALSGPGRMRYGIAGVESLLVLALEAIRPAVVQLRIGARHYHLLSRIAELLPQTTILCEPVDVSGMLTWPDGGRDDVLRGVHMLVAPCVGTAWDQLTASRPFECQSYYPIPDWDDEAAGLPKGFSYLSPSANLGEGLKTLMTMLVSASGPPGAVSFDSVVESVADAEGIYVDMVWPCQSGPVPRTIGQGGGGRVRRIGAMHQTRFLRILGGYDYGWLHPDWLREVDGMMIPALFCACIAAELPVFVHRDFIQASALVKEYGAGLVVAGYNASSLRDALRVADPVAHKRGARLLRDAMRRHNRDALAQIAAFIDRRAKSLADDKGGDVVGGGNPGIVDTARCRVL